MNIQEKTNKTTIQAQSVQGEAFLYEWVNRTNGKSYLGYHTGTPDDDYFHSSKNEEMIRDFNNPEMDWERFILMFGSTDEMKQQENNKLKSYKNNSKMWNMMYNDSVGFPAYREPYSQEHFTFALNNIKGDCYDVIDELTANVKDIEHHQCRLVEFEQGKVREIANRMRETGTQFCEPLVILECTAYSEEPILINGNHTRAAAIKSGQHRIPVKYIPADDCKSFNEEFVDALGNALNARDKKIKTVVDDITLINVLIRRFEEYNMPIDSAANIDYLSSCGLTKGETRKIIKKALSECKNNEMSQTRGQLISHNKKSLDQQRQRIDSGDAIIVTFSSGAFQTNKLMSKMMERPQCKKVKILIHHTNHDLMDRWESKNPNVEGQLYWENAMRTLMPDYEFIWCVADKYVDS